MGSPRCGGRSSHLVQKHPPSNFQPPTSNLQPPTSSLQTPTSNQVREQVSQGLGALPAQHYACVDIELLPSPREDGDEEWGGGGIAKQLKQV